MLKRHWTSARFAPEIIRSTAEAIKQIANRNEVILIGFSGGAQVAGLVRILILKKSLPLPEILTIWLGHNIIICRLYQSL